MSWTTQLLTQQQSLDKGLTDLNHHSQASLEDRKGFYGIRFVENDSDMYFEHEMKIEKWDTGICDHDKTPFSVALYSNGEKTYWEPMIEREVNLAYFKLGNVTDYKIVYINTVQLDEVGPREKHDEYIAHFKYKY